MEKHLCCFPNATNSSTAKKCLPKKCYLHFVCTINLAMHIYTHTYVHLFISSESDITDFLCHYRTAFPMATITPKLHMIKDHVVDFISVWKVGMGMLGEQGAESIHTVFNQLHRTYANINNRVERLKSMVTEHHRQVCPINASCQILPCKRKQTEE